MADTRTGPRPPVFEFSGGSLCLDFANTLGDRPRGAKEDLRSYGDLLAWGLQADLLDESQIRGLERRAARNPAESEAVFRAAIELRESLYRIFSARAAGRAPSAKDLSALNRSLGEAMRFARLKPDGEKFRWSWSDPGATEVVSRSVVRAAAELLTSDELDFLRECASETCSWLFLDHSRTRRRRWCDMKTCGNRAKARRYYDRQKARASKQAKG